MLGMIPRFHFTAACCCILAAFAAARADDRAATLRRYVAECVADPKMIVFNPPADLHAYANLSLKELEKRRSEIFRNGAVLILYPDGLPMKLGTNTNFQPDGPAKTWYEGGALQSEETWRGGELAEGRYFAPDGQILAEVKDGRGRQLEFSMPYRSEPVSVSRETEIADGVKNGFEKTYESGKLRGERHYRDGKLDGIEKGWMSNGQLNFEQSYAAGQQQGETTYWHENGRVRSRAQYDHGQQIGASSRYAESGQMLEETLRDGTSTRWEMKWYPEGSLMVWKAYDPQSHRVTKGESFTREGRRNGEVKDGSGHLVVADSETSFFANDRFEVEIYAADGSISRDRLPVLAWSSGGGSGHAATLTLQAQGAPHFSRLSSQILPVAGTTAQDPATYDFDLTADKTIPVSVPLPEDHSQWSGTIYARTTATGERGAYEFVQAVYSSRPHAQPIFGGSHPTPKPTPYDAGPLRRAEKPVVNGQELPPLSQALNCWTFGHTIWVLYDNPPWLISRAGSAKEWSLVRIFPERPEGFVLLSGDHLVAWQTKPTATPERGIPHVVEDSVDGGKTWKTFSIPEMDYLTGMNILENALMVSGVRLPQGGLPAGQDWFELPKIVFYSSDQGRHFVEDRGPSLLNLSPTAIKSVAPNGNRRAYVRDTGFVDARCQISLADTLGMIPRGVLNAGSRPELVWSGNSEVLALRSQGKFFAYYDCRTHRGESHSQPGDRYAQPSAKLTAALEETDARIRAILEAAK